MRHHQNKPTQTTFEEALASLLTRHKITDPKDTPLPPLQPAILASLLHIHTHMTERFATPLSCSLHSHAYHATHAEDLQFGANPAPYTMPWTGYSVATPPPR